MSVLWIPHRVNRVTPGMRVDWGHPLAQRLFAGIVATSAGAVDLVSGCVMRNGGVTFSTRVRPYGLSLHKDASYNALVTGSGPAPAAPNGSHHSGFMLAYDVSTNVPLCGDGNGWIVEGGLLKLWAASGRRAIGATTLSSTGELRLGFSAYHGEYWNYVNGAQDGYDAITAGTIGTTFTIGGGGWSFWSGTMGFTLFLQWTRLLSAWEHRAIAADPFQIFVVDVPFFDGASAAPSFNPAWAFGANTVIQGALHA